MYMYMYINPIFFNVIRENSWDSSRDILYKRNCGCINLILRNFLVFLDLLQSIFILNMTNYFNVYNNRKIISNLNNLKLKKGFS